MTPTTAPGAQRALILAAAHPGAGFPGPPLPLCLHHVGGEVLLERAVAEARAAGAATIRVVVGFSAERVRSHLHQARRRVGAVEVAENPRWRDDPMAALEYGWGGWEGKPLLAVSADVVHAGPSSWWIPAPHPRPLPRGEGWAAAAERLGWRPGPFPPTPDYSGTDEARLAPLLPAAWRRAGPPACTPETPRCDTWHNAMEGSRPPCCTRHLRELLRFTDDLLTRHGIYHWLDYGPLLGAVRDGGLIRWDYDVDFGVWYQDRERVAALRREIAEAGHVLDMGEDGVWRILLSRRNHLHADLFPWREQGESATLCGRFENWGPTPRHFLERLAPVRLFGRGFLAPSPVEAFLEHRYGADYRTPRADTGPAPGPEAALGTFLTRRWRRDQFRANLRQLHDLLAATPLAAQYWLWGRQLIGAVRDGDVLKTEGNTCEFALRRGSRAGLEGALPALEAAGFRRRSRQRNPEGEAAAVHLAKDDADFVFTVMDERGGQLHWFGFQRGTRTEYAIAAFDLSPLAWLDRQWLGPADPEAVLSARYGAWRARGAAGDPLPSDGCIVATAPWLEPLRP